MVLAAWVKRRQLKQGIEIGLEQGIEQGKEQGIEIGKKQGIAEERKRTNAKLRALAKEYGIPEEKLEIEDETESE